MTASEFTFLALGLVLGVASGAALIEVLRSRPPAPREVRVTVAPNAIQARLPSTLADPSASLDRRPPPAGRAIAAGTTTRRIPSRHRADAGASDPLAATVLMARGGAATAASARRSRRERRRHRRAAGLERLFRFASTPSGP